MDLTFNCPDTVLMLGNESEHMTDSQLNSAARFAAKLGFKAITFKVGDGNIRYRNAHETLQAINAVNDTGMGAMPFIYIYGPKFGDAQIKLEASIITEIADTAFGEVVVDMESEWNNNPRACGLLRDGLKSFVDSKHSLIISTWADPVQQGWVQNIQELNPVVEKYGAWSPQQYSLWLLQQEHQLITMKGDIFPEANMMVDPIAVAAQASSKRHKSFWVWYYVSVESMQNLARTVIQTFVKGEETHVIPVVPKPVTPITPKPVTVPTTPVVQPPVTPVVPTSDDWLNSAIQEGEKIVEDVVDDPEVQKEVVGTAEDILLQLASGKPDYPHIVVEAWDTVESIALRAGVDAEHVLNLNPGLEELLKQGLDSVGKLVKI